MNTTTYETAAVDEPVARPCPQKGCDWVGPHWHEYSGQAVECTHGGRVSHTRCYGTRTEVEA